MHAERLYKFVQWMMRREQFCGWNDDNDVESMKANLNTERTTRAPENLTPKLPKNNY